MHTCIHKQAGRRAHAHTHTQQEGERERQGTEEKRRDYVFLKLAYVTS